MSPLSPSMIACPWLSALNRPFRYMVAMSCMKMASIGVCFELQMEQGRKSHYNNPDSQLHEQEQATDVD